VKEYLFSYGTLQEEEVQFALFGRSLTGFSDMLIGYEISPIEITDEAFLSRGEETEQLTLVPSRDKQGKIEGTVFEVSEDELFLAEKYEPHNYKRIKVRLESGKQAWVYLAAETRPY
jgi:Gamma-glutamyl cyclotransferase, AIG2-like